MNVNGLCLGGRRASTDSEVVSIASDDSLMFWADYEEMLDNLVSFNKIHVLSKTQYSSHKFLC